MATTESSLKTRKDSLLVKIEKLLADKADIAKSQGKRFAIFAHPCPDPDAIGSMMSMAFLLKKKYDVEVDCFSDGIISHPENRAMGNLLDPDLILAEEYVAESYCCNILCDTIPSHAATAGKNVEFNLVVDHHKLAPNGNFKGIFYNLKAGSCCGTVYHLIKNFGLIFDENSERDRQIATALMIGVRSDTNDFMSEDTTELEFTTYKELFPFRNAIALKQIINYKIPKPWLAQIQAAAGQAGMDDDIGIYGVGFITPTQRDMISFLADFLQTWNETSVVFAIVDGTRVEGSVRTINNHINVPLLCKELGGEHGDGGGKLGKGAYHYPLGNFSLAEGDSKEIFDKMWDFVKVRETAVIREALKK